MGEAIVLETIKFQFESEKRYYRDLEESGRPHLPWKQGLASSNLAIPTND